MLPTKFRFIWTSGFRGEDFLEINQSTRGSQEPVIAHPVFNLTSKVDRKWGLDFFFQLSIAALLQIKF
jgi:hypothetical protein